MRFTKCFLGAQPFQARPEAHGQFARQLDFVLPPVMGRGMIEAQRKAPLAVPDERRADERGNFERGEFLRGRARVCGRIAHHDNFFGPGRADELLLHKIRQAINSDQARHIFAMPVLADHHLLRRLVNFGKCTKREVEMRADFRADGLHHFHNARATHEVVADCGQKFEIQFRPSAPGHVARDGEQPRGLAVRIQNRRNLYVPPFGFTAQRAEKTDEVSLPARRRGRDRHSRRLTIFVLPELDPRFVQVRPDVFDAQQGLPVLHGEQIPFEVEHLDAVRAAFDDTTAERFAFAQGILGLLALSDVGVNTHPFADSAVLPE